MHALLAAFALLLPTQARADAGTLALTAGDVFIKKGGEGEWTAAKEPLQLGEGDMLKTREGSMAEIALADGSRVRLGQNTDFQIHEAKPSRFALFVRLGTLEGFIHKLRHGNSFDLRTPNSVAAIRGTDIRVDVDRSGGANWSLFTGSLAVFDGHGVHVTLTPHQTVSVTPNGTLGKPERTPPSIKAPEPPKIKALDASKSHAGPSKGEPKGGPKAELKVASLTGNLSVTVNGKTTVYTPATLPADFTIPAGAEVKVLSGSAILLGPAGALQAGEGASFTTSASKSGGLDVAVGADSTKMHLEVGGKIAVLGPKDNVEVNLVGGNQTMKSDSGRIPVVDPSGGTSEMKPGEPPLSTSPGAQPPPNEPPPGQQQPGTQPPPPTNQQNLENSVSPSAP